MGEKCVRMRISDSRAERRDRRRLGVSPNLSLPPVSVEEPPGGRKVTQGAGNRIVTERKLKFSLHVKVRLSGQIFP